MVESEGKQLASIQYCTSIRPELEEKGKKRERTREGEKERGGKREGEICRKKDRKQK